MGQIVGKIEVPLEVLDEEYLLRIVYHPFHYSESKDCLKPEVFMPTPVERDEVSILRFSYCDLDFCKSFAITKSNKKFIGLTYLKCSEVREIRFDSFYGGNPIATPLDDNLNKRVDSPIYADDKGVPSHGDIKYNFDISDAHKPIKQELSRHIFKPLVNLCISRFYKDNNLDSNDWCGEKILFH